MEARVIIATQTLIKNLAVIRETMPDQKIYPVVKGDGYGLGLSALARILNHDADGFCVGLESEAITLASDPEVTKPILLMSPLFDPAHVLEYGFIPTIESIDQLAVLEALARAHQTPLSYQVKLESGLHRFGLSEEGLEAFATAIKDAKWTRLTGAFSHFQDVKNEALVKKQLAIFTSHVKQFRAAGIEIPLCHMANGEAAIDYPETRLDLVRVGNVLYGKGHTRSSLSLKRPDHLEIPIVKIQTIASGKSIGYSGSFTTKKMTRVGLIPFGFDDGLRVGRLPAPLKTSELIRAVGRLVLRYFKPISPISYQKKSVPLLGREYMQFATVDLTDFPELEVGDLLRIEMSSFFINPGIKRIYQ